MSSSLGVVHSFRCMNFFFPGSYSIRSQQTVLQLPLNESEAGGDLVLVETSCFCYVSDAVLILIRRNLHKKSSEVCIETRSPSASFSFKGQATKHRTVNMVYCNNFQAIECVHSGEQKPYLHSETKGGICIKIEFNPQKNLSLLQDGRGFFVYSSNMAAVTSCKHTLLCLHVMSPRL